MPVFLGAGSLIFDLLFMVVMHLEQLVFVAFNVRDKKCEIFEKRHVSTQSN